MNTYENEKLLIEAIERLQKSKDCMVIAYSLENEETSQKIMTLSKQLENESKELVNKVLQSHNPVTVKIQIK